MRNGFLEGWADLSGVSQSLKIRIDDSVELHTQARLYRDDLAAAGIRSGFAGFKAPVPCYLLDGAEHRVELLGPDDAHLQSAVIRFDIPEQIKLLKRSIVSASGTLKRVKGQKIALLCGYEPDGKVTVNSQAIIKVLQQAGFKVVFIIASDNPQAIDQPLESPAEINILRKNGGYDFGSWATAYLYLRDLLGGTVPEAVLLMNDSMLWTGEPLDTKFCRLRRGDVELDLLGATESYDRNYHLQSFYLLFSKRIVERNVLDEFLFYQSGSSSSRDDVIAKFELSTHKFFAAKGFVTGAAIGYHELLADLWPDLMAYVDVHQRNFAADFQPRLAGVHEALNWMNAIRAGDAINPSHTGWLQLCRKGFPFIKKEIVLRNPVHVPFFEKIRAAFHGPACTELDEFVRSHTGCLVPAAVSFTNVRPPDHAGPAERDRRHESDPEGLRIPAEYPGLVPSFE